MDKTWIFIFVVAAWLGAATGEFSNACYGTDPECDYYNMTCGAGEVIRLDNLYVGHKTAQACTNSSDHCQNANECCLYSNGDSTELFDLENTYNAYTNCSGRQLCSGIQAPWQLMETLSDFQQLIYSTYVQLEYSCEQASGIIPICGGPNKIFSVVNNVAEIRFDGSIETFDPDIASKECKCRIHNNAAASQITVTYSIIDIRLQSHYKAINESAAQCSSAVFSLGVMATQCVETDKHYEDNFKYSNLQEQYTVPIGMGGSADVTLTDIYTNGQRDSPAMVWVDIAADSTFQIICEEVIPADFTTTTTSTTTTTPIPTTTTTTTPIPTTTTTTTPIPTTTTTTTPVPTTTTTTVPTTTTTTTVPTTTTTTTPVPTTTTTTTPIPTTTTTTTPVPTTTTTTTPIPTTTTTTTPVPTTTTTTTPVPTTTTTTTPVPTTTTTTPVPTTTTTTTPVPTTTTTTTIPTTTTTTIKPTTTTTTIKPTTTTTTSTTTTPTTRQTTPTTTTTPPITPSPTTPTTSTTSATTAGGKKSAVKVSGTEDASIYLAIFIPTAVCVVLVIIFIVWVYFKRTSAKRPIKLKMMKNSTGDEIYKKFNNPDILDEFIKRNAGSRGTSVFGSEKSPITSYITVPTNRQPLPQTDVYNTEALPIERRMTNGSVHKPGPYVIPVNVNHRTSNGTAKPMTNGSTNPNVSFVRIQRPTKSQDVAHLRNSTEGFPSVYEPKYVSIRRPNRQPTQPRAKSTPETGYSPREQPPQKRASKVDFDDGAVVIHVDNISNPSASGSQSPSSSRGTKSPVMSSNGSNKRGNHSPNSSNYSSAANDNSRARISFRDASPERLSPRDSNPAMISVGQIDNRHSGQATVLPPNENGDSGVVFVKL